MITIWYEFSGLTELVADFRRAEAKLAEGFDEPLRRTRDALWQTIRELFASSGQSTTRGAVPFPWAPWSPVTEFLRTHQGGASHSLQGHYDRLAGPVQDVIGVWSGEMREAMASDTAPGFSEVTSDTLTMGINPVGGIGQKWIDFVEGRVGDEYDPPQPARAVYENLPADEVAEDVFANWLRDEVPIFQQAESEQSEFLGLS